MGTDESFASVLIFEVAERDFERLSREATETLGREGMSISGLIETALLGNEARTELWFISRWESRDAWARSRWDQGVGQIVTDLVESAVTHRYEGLTPLAVVRPRE